MKKSKLPPYKNFPILADTRISLRQIEDEDLKNLVSISYYDGIQAQTEPQAREMLERIYQDYIQGNSVHWGIIENQTGKIVGTCGYYRGFQKEAGELGCVLLPEFRGVGYMTAAMQLAVGFGRNHMNLQRIWAATSKENIEAIRLLKRSNFRKTAELQDEVEFDHHG